MNICFMPLHISHYLKLTTNAVSMHLELKIFNNFKGSTCVKKLIVLSLGLYAQVNVTEHQGKKTCPCASRPGNSQPCLELLDVRGLALIHI